MPHHTLTAPDTSPQRRIHGFVQGGEARAKRIARPSHDAIILISANPELAPELRSGAEVEQMQLTIIGKVVWSGQMLPGKSRYRRKRPKYRSS